MPIETPISRLVHDDFIVPSIEEIVAANPPVSIGMDLGRDGDMSAVAIACRVDEFTRVVAQSGVSAEQAAARFAEWTNAAFGIWRKVPALAPLRKAVPLVDWLLSPSERVYQVLAEVGPDGLSPKAMCRALGIPWVARLVAFENCSQEMADACSALSPSAFAQTYPKPGENPTPQLWARMVARAGDNAHWVAHNAKELRRSNHLDAILQAVDYAASVPYQFPRSKTVAAVVAESVVWHRGLEGNPRLAPVDGTARDEEIKRLSCAYWLTDRQRIEYPFATVLTTDDYEFHLLTTTAEFFEEGIALWNCLREGRYWQSAESKRIMMASLRKAEQRLATIELSMSGSVIQIRGPQNTYVSDELEQVAKSFAFRLQQEIIEKVGPVNQEREVLRIVGGDHDGEMFDVAVGQDFLELPTRDGEVWENFTRLGHAISDYRPAVLRTETYARRRTPSGYVLALASMSDEEVAEAMRMRTGMRFYMHEQVRTLVHRPNPLSGLSGIDT